jgi:hypothetical protein
MQVHEDQSDDFKKKYVVRNIIEYLDAVKDIKSQDQTVWFRGQEKASYRLVPGAMRECYDYENQFGRKVEPSRVESYNW